MKTASPSGGGKERHRARGFAVRCFRLVLFPLFGWACGLALQAEPLPGLDLTATRSVSGQFIISGCKGFSPLAHAPQIIADTNLVRLEPATLSVTAERIRQFIWHDLGIEAGPPGQGTCYLLLHPANTPLDEVTIVTQPFGRRWDYQVQLPDVLLKRRFIRAMTGAILLEFANRQANPAGNPVEIPGWLVDGLTQRLLADDRQNLVLSAPGRLVNGLVQVRIVDKQQGIDPMADARQVLVASPALSFQQMNWPTEAQIDGDDGGVYLASAGVFVNALLDLKNGPAGLRAMLTQLPACHNWQTAFQAAFQGTFPRSLDLEKWWAVQVVDFVSRGTGPAWTPMISREKLDEILAVPVAVRASSNALPSHAEISLQAVLRNFNETQQASILGLKLRDLESTELRLAPPLASLADGYRLVLARYLGVSSELPETRLHRRETQTNRRYSLRSTLEKLDELDVLRRRVEAAVKPEVFTPGQG